MTESRHGGDFIVRPVGQDPIFTIEQISEEDREMAKFAQEFIKKKLTQKTYKKIMMPNETRLKQACQDPEWNALKVKRAFTRPNIEEIVKLLHEAGENGLMGVDVPEKYGGLMENPSEVFKDLISKHMAQTPFSDAIGVALMCHRGIGIHPLLWYGNKDQKDRYLEKLATGEWFGAYALTEPQAGSDAESLKTKAVLSEDGKTYILNGTKQFITNAGFADLYTVFAKVDGDDKKITAFLVEADSKGLSTGFDEEKLGMHSSSTRTVTLENVRVPKENQLGKIGQGFKIALVVLTKGRKTLATACLGSSIKCVNDMIARGFDREQFGVPIAYFGAIQNKIAKCAIQAYALESAIFRLSGLIDEHIKDPYSEENGYSEDEKQSLYYKQVTKIQEKFTIEGCLLKFSGSEIQGNIVNHNVQLHGGEGYITEYAPARAYADHKINEIWEGSNEINRKVAAGFFYKNAAMNLLPMRQYKMYVDYLIKGKIKPDINVHPDLETQAQTVEYAKALLGYTFSQCLARFGREMETDQHVHENLANMLSEIYLTESALLRTSQCLQNNEKHGQLRTNITTHAVSEMCEKIYGWALELLLYASEPAYHKEILDDLCELCSKTLIVNRIDLRKQIAAEILRLKKYPF